LVKKFSSWLIFIILVILLLIILGGFIWLLIQGKIIPMQVIGGIEAPIGNSVSVITPTVLPTPGVIVNYSNPPSSQGLFILALKQGVSTCQ